MPTETPEQFFFRVGREDALSLCHSSLLEHRQYEAAIVNLLRANAKRHLVHPNSNYTNPHYTAGIVSVLVQSQNHEVTEAERDFYRRAFLRRCEDANHEPYDGVPADTGSV